MDDPRSVFRAAADFLSGKLFGDHDAQISSVGQLLDSVGLGVENRHAAAEPGRLDSARLLRVAAEFDGFFRLRSRQAPGVAFFGGLITPRDIDGSRLPEMTISISGAGQSLGEAFRSCVGEGVEYVAQFMRRDVAIRSGTMQDAADWNGRPHTAAMVHWIGMEDQAIDWIAAERISDGHELWIPACLALRPTNSDRWAVGSGCAAGPTSADALKSAMLEVIERDAVAMWWRGGRSLAAVTDDQRAALGVDHLLDWVRQGGTDRVTTLYQIQCDFGPVCLAAVSSDTDGGQFAGGYACHVDPVLACRSAIREMCQMELGNEIVANRLARSGQPASETDVSILNRQASIRIDGQQFRCDRNADLEIQDQRTPEEIASALATAGYEAYFVDLTMDHFGVPVAKVVVPGLQPYPSGYQTPRLTKSIAERINSDHASEVDLF